MDPPHGSTIMMLAEAGRKSRVGKEDMWTAWPFGSPFSSPRPSGLKGEVGGSCQGPVFAQTSYLPVGTDYGR